MYAFKAINSLILQYLVNFLQARTAKEEAFVSIPFLNMSARNAEEVKSVFTIESAVNAK